MICLNSETKYLIKLIKKLQLFYKYIFLHIFIFIKSNCSRSNNYFTMMNYILFYGCNKHNNNTEQILS